MIIGFSSYGRGGSGPALGYLTGYLVNGVERNSMPEVVRGNPAVVGEIIDALPFKCRYSSGVLSFAPEDHVTAEIQEDIMNRFENSVFAGLPPDRRSIVWIKHSDKGRTELHFVVARVDLGTRKSLNIAPPTPASRHLLDTLRESINRRYGFRDPGDPSCAQVVSRPAHVAKLAAQAKRLNRSTKTDIRQSIAEDLQSQALKGLIASRGDVARWLNEQGFTITRAGVNYLTIKLSDSEERVRLKGNIFREHFCPQDLRPSLVRHDLARLLTLDRRLERLVEKRAEYHTARYAVIEKTEALSNVKEESSYDRTRNATARDGAALRKIPSGLQSTVRPEYFRLGEAAQHYGDASRRIGQACDGLKGACRSFAFAFDQALMEVNRNNRSDALVRDYGLPRQERSKGYGFELELEL